jgi:hypothetical protein
VACFIPFAYKIGISSIEGMHIVRERQCTYERSIEAHWHNHCCRGKALKFSIFWVCVSVTLVIQDAKLLRRFFCHLWPVWLYSISPHCLRNGESKKLLNVDCVLILSTTFVSNIFYSKKNSVSHKCNVKCLLFFSDFNQTSIFSTDILEYSNIKFNENQSSGIRVVPCGQTDRHDRGNSRFSQFCKST